MKISKKTREQAALICAIAASGRDFATYIEDAAIHLGMSEDDSIEQHAAALLAFKAVVLAEREMLKATGFGGWHRENYAEVEALLRTGWSP